MVENKPVRGQPITVAQELPTIDKNNLIACPKCGEQMIILANVPSGDGKIVKMTVMCEVCSIIGTVDTKTISRFLVDSKGDKIA